MTNNKDTEITTPKIRELENRIIDITREQKKTSDNDKLQALEMERQELFKERRELLNKREEN